MCPENGLQGSGMPPEARPTGLNSARDRPGSRQKNPAPLLGRSRLWGPPRTYFFWPCGPYIRAGQAGKLFRPFCHFVLQLFSVECLILKHEVTKKAKKFLGLPCPDVGAAGPKKIGAGSPEAGCRPSKGAGFCLRPPSRFSRKF